MSEVELFGTGPRRDPVLVDSDRVESTDLDPTLGICCSFFSSLGGVLFLIQNAMIMRASP